MKPIIIILSFGMLPLISLAQKQETHIKEGNEFFKKGMLLEAIAEYDKVTDERLRYTALLNKGTALYKLRKYDEALKVYQQVSTAPDAAPELRSGAYYNTGVVYSNQEKIEESIEAYKNALRLNAQDHNARENLQKALSQRNKSGGGSNNDRPQPSSSKLNKNQAQQQLERLEQKEKNTQSNLSSQKRQNMGSAGKDW